MRVRRAAPILSTLVMMTAAVHGAAVYFADPNLKAVVEATLGVPDPTPEDMSGLSSLAGWRLGIADLTGLEYATNLTVLDLYDNSISDLSPLGGLIHLEELNVGQNRISDFSLLSGLSELRILNIHGNPTGDLTGVSGLSSLEELTAYEMQISDLSPLSALGNLCYLVLDENRISDLSPLAGLDRLQSLSLGSNQISDLSAVAGLTDLDTLSVTRNQISDLSALSGLLNLETLNLFGNGVSDISVLAWLPSLKEVSLIANPLGAEACAVIHELEDRGVSVLYDHDDCNPSVSQHSLVISSTAGGSVADPGEGTLPYEDGEIVRLEARADPTFVFVGWSGSLISRQNPVSLTMDQDHDVRAHFLSLLDTLYVDDDAPADPGPWDKTVGDPLEDGSSDHPFDSIQEAVDVAGEGVRVIVRPGTYRENIDLLGKGILVMGADPNDQGRNPYPTIAGEGGGPVLRFAQGERSTCMVTGFTITGAAGQPNETILCAGSSPTLERCLIVGNRVTTQKGAIVRCTNSQAAFTHCTIADNYAGAQGAVLSLINSPITLTNSIVWGHGPKVTVLNDAVRPTLRYTDITGGWDGPGNRAVDPLFARPGHWADPGDPDVAWEAADPQAVWIEGDYHLRSQVGRWGPQTRTWVRDPVSSPCIDAGDPARSVGYESVPHGGIINMGAYGGTAQASQSVLDSIQ